MDTVADNASEAQDRLIAALRTRLARDAGREVPVLQTHISYVLLTGEFAYKVKKAVRLGFLDFTTLAARRHYCDEELRLNRRLAPDIYLDVVALTGTIDAPVIGGSGPVLDYAVKMYEFPQDALLSRVLARGALTTNRVDRLAATVAAFHREVDVAGANGPFGAPEEILALALANFTEMRPLVSEADDHAAIARLEAWTRDAFAGLRARFEARREGGFVRECHGDLHLGNVALIDERIVVFDCIEFNAHMRFVDVMNEVAFTVMDLEHAGRPDLAHRYLNAYLEDSGDYGGVGMLAFYLVYRACVRAKVACLRAVTLAPGPTRAAFERDCREYLALAATYTRSPRPAVVVMHGFAASGKSTVSQALLEQGGAIRLRSDVERKRMQGVPPRGRSDSGIAEGLYASAITRTTYAWLALLARQIVDGGRIALVDATFLRRWQRDLFHDLAAELGVPFIVVDVVAREGTLRERLRQRALGPADVSEAGLDVLDHQLRTDEPLGDDELAVAERCDTERSLDEGQHARLWNAVDARVTQTVSVPHSRASPAAPSLARKVAFLAQAASYPERTAAVEGVETHMSWVFLTDRHAYKLKKPVKTPLVDLREARARLSNCMDEVRLNRRLSTGVYLGVVPLLVDAKGRLGLAEGADAVDWLVQMRRLPADRMLDALIGARNVRHEDVAALAARLCAFYRDARRVELRPVDYRDAFAASIAEHRDGLARPRYALDVARLERIARRQRDVLADVALFDVRVREQRIVEAHGDLRPEHVCFEAEPQIIDCLEFSRRLRTLDALDEIGFLALECERLGAPDVGAVILEAYRSQSGDPSPPKLLHFYQSYRAIVRATLAVRHLEEPGRNDAAKWIARANAYLDLA
ncbi:MAG: AAA family ATPase, partial [Betaproteobacteria bacterium]